MKMNKILIMLTVLLFSISTVFAATCTLYEEGTFSASGNYTGINNNTATTIDITSEQYITAYTSMTPTANITVAVTENITAGVNNSANTLIWKSPYNISANGFQILNGTSVISPTNYTLTNISSTWVVTWKDDIYNGTSVAVTYNRTFVPNVDDLIASPASIVSGTTSAYWITTTASTAYGVDGTLILKSTLYGPIINNTNWTVTYSYTERSCIAYSADSATYSGISNTRTILYAAFALLTVLVLITIIWSIIALVQGGQVDLITVMVTGIGGGLVIMIAFIIIYYISNALIGI